MSTDNKHYNPMKILPEHRKAVTKVKISGKIKAETANAILFTLESNGESHWIPLSQVSEIHRTFSIVDIRYDELVISQWIAEKKGLVESND